MCRRLKRWCVSGVPTTSRHARERTSGTTASSARHASTKPRSESAPPASCSSRIGAGPRRRGPGGTAGGLLFSMVDRQAEVGLERGEARGEARGEPRGER